MQTIEPDKDRGIISLTPVEIQNIERTIKGKKTGQAIQNNLPKLHFQGSWKMVSQIYRALNERKIYTMKGNGEIYKIKIDKIEWIEKFKTFFVDGIRIIKDQGIGKKIEKIIFTMGRNEPRIDVKVNKKNRRNRRRNKDVGAN